MADKRKVETPHTPDLIHEGYLWQQAIQRVAGLDEAGRGALAGPVSAAAVVLPVEAGLSGVWANVRDSKTLSAKRRQHLAHEIEIQAADWAVGWASAEEIDALGIAPATRLAMVRAVAGLTRQPDYLLIDWVRLPTLNLPQESFVKGDARIVSIAAASILAKVYRDQYMVALAATYPAYGFERHKGYGSAAHLRVLEEQGPAPAHRRSFAPLANRLPLFAPDSSPTPSTPLPKDAQP